MRTERQIFEAGCHCGQLTAVLTTALEPQSLHPRACDCSFCRKHGAAWISDPGGRLSIADRSGGRLVRYRQGSNAAQFLLCGDCGVLVAVLFTHDARVYGALNAGSLEQADALGARIPASPQQLSAEAKTGRWIQLWTPDVVLDSREE